MSFSPISHCFALKTTGRDQNFFQPIRLLVVQMFSRLKVLCRPFWGISDNLSAQLHFVHFIGATLSEGKFQNIFSTFCSRLSTHSHSTLREALMTNSEKQDIDMSSCPHFIMSSCNLVIMSSCHYVIISSCHHVNVIKSSCHHLFNLSSCHLIILSHCQHVIQSSVSRVARKLVALSICQLFSFSSNASWSLRACSICNDNPTFFVPLWMNV